MEAALRAAYPEFNWDSTKFRITWPKRNRTWRSRVPRRRKVAAVLGRKLLQEFAMDVGFNPNLPENWATISHKRVRDWAVCVISLSILF